MLSFVSSFTLGHREMEDLTGQKTVENREGIDEEAD